MGSPSDDELVFAVFETTPRAQTAVRTFTSRWAAEQARGVSVGTLVRGVTGEVFCGTEPTAPPPDEIARFLQLLAQEFSDASPRTAIGGARVTLSFGVTPDDLSRLGAELDAGHVIVVVVTPHDTADEVIVDLARIGGRTEFRRGEAHGAGGGRVVGLG